MSKVRLRSGQILGVGPGAAKLPLRHACAFGQAHKLEFLFFLQPTYWSVFQHRPDRASEPQSSWRIYTDDDSGTASLATGHSTCFVWCLDWLTLFR